MNLGIDGQLLIGKVTGMGVALENILKRITIPDKCKVYLYVPDIPEDNLIQLDKENLIIRRLKFRNYLFWEQFVLTRQAKLDNLDAFWFPYNTASIFMNCRKIITIHDVIYMHGSLFAPQTLYKKMGKIYRRVNVPITARQANQIITVSQYSKEEIAHFLPDIANKINICYLGCEKTYNYLSEENWNLFKRNNKIRGKYILAVGSFEKRKNTINSIKSFQLVKKEYPELELVLYGFSNYINSKEFNYVKQSQISGVHFLEYVTNEEKNTLYRNAECFLFPSFEEGFGIPILESFYHHTLVITSNCSAMPEIAGNAAIYVNPCKVESIASGIKSALVDDSKEKIALGIERLKIFDWDRTAKKVSTLLFDLEKS